MRDVEDAAALNAFSEAAHTLNRLKAQKRAEPSLVLAYHDRSDGGLYTTVAGGVFRKTGASIDLGALGAAATAESVAAQGCTSWGCPSVRPSATELGKNCLFGGRATHGRGAGRAASGLFREELRDELPALAPGSACPGARSVGFSSPCWSRVGQLCGQAAQLSPAPNLQLYCCTGVRASDIHYGLCAVQRDLGGETLEKAPAQGRAGLSVAGSLWENRVGSMAS